MKALRYDTELKIRDIPRPARAPGEALIRVTLAGICNTDLEITRGYVPGFDGVPGHEFIGLIEEADDPALIGKRATAEINCSCGKCAYCAAGLGRHCPRRTVLGIINRQGAFAEYVTVPAAQLVMIPDTIPDSQAIFLEPMAAALEILSQVAIDPQKTVLLLGDGKLAQLIARALSSTGCDLTVVGKHSEKLDHLRDLPCRTVLLDDFGSSAFDIVTEATGNPDAFELGLSCVRPRGTMVLKSTYARAFPFNPARIVVDEITVVGSRCGVFADALSFFEDHPHPLDHLISDRFPLTQASEAFARAESSDSMKVVLDIG